MSARAAGVKYFKLIMNKTLIYIITLVILATVSTPVLAMSWERVDSGVNELKVSGECDGREVTVYLYPNDGGEPIYSAGAECKNGKFEFEDDLNHWNILNNSYRVVVGEGQDNPDFSKKEEMFVGQNIDSATPLSSSNSESGAILAVEPQEESGPMDSSEEIQAPGLLSGLVEQVMKFFASLGVSIENGIAKFVELTARKIVVENIEIKEAIIENATIQNFEVLKKIQLRDQATNEIYCTWLENGEWKKVSESCEKPFSGAEIVPEENLPVDSATTTADSVINQNEYATSTQNIN